MAALKTKPRKTAKDYLKLPEGTLAELIDGEIFVTPSPRPNHQQIARALTLAIGNFLESQPQLGRTCIPPSDVHLPSGDIVGPALIFISKGRTRIVKDWIRGAPDLLVEILSPTSVDRDLLVKRELYARNGVLEYWVVDPIETAIQVYTLRKKVYGAAGWYRRGTTITTPLLPRFKLDVSTIFE